MRIFYLIIFFLYSLNSLSQQDESFYQEADEFFDKHVSNGNVDYKEIRSSPNALNALVHMISKTNVEKMSADEKKAFYINAYNVLTIKNVIDHYPVKSPLKVEGFFDKIKFDVGGEKLTLNQIENEKLRKTGDARIHFVLVCAAKGCPQLLKGAYFPEKIDQQVRTQTMKAINDADFTRIDRKEKVVLLSEIFKWYQEDFGTGKSAIVDYLNKYLEQPVSPSFELGYYAYDWELNDLK